jgi:prolipoprotein diacylglyceryl transferase
MLVGQAIGRIANFINQELYGPPTTFPWGIPISAEHRLPEFASLPASTRFHPTFAYEMIWNILTASLLLWLARRYEKRLKPGTIFAGWLIAAGLGRAWLELFFRPDQPKIPGWGLSYSGLVSALMAIAGIVLLLVRYKKINLAFAQNWEEEYKVSMQPAAVTQEQEAGKAIKTNRESTLRKKAKAKIAERKAEKESSPRPTRAKKSS